MFNMPVTPEDPAPDQQRVLQEIYRWLTLKGRWPTFVQIDKILDRIGIDLQGISATFPRGLSSLGHRMMSDNDELSLLPEALVHCRPDSTDDMDLILRAVWHCEERERSHEPAEGAAMPNVTGQELESALGYPESRLLRVYFILQFDHWVAGSGITNDDHFNMHVGRLIRKYRGVQTYADYLAVRAGFRAEASNRLQYNASRPVSQSGDDQSLAPPGSLMATDTAGDRHTNASENAAQEPPAEPYQYDVALSYAGEDREYVAHVADALRRASVQVFFDIYEEATLWGRDLAAHLDDVYRKQSRFVVMFVSQHYAAKAWPSHERRSAQARAIQQQGDFLLPARIDDTDVPGLSPTIAYVDCRRKSADELAALIVEKMRQVAGVTEDRPAHSAPNLRVQATGGPSPELRLIVTNHGHADTFQATAKIVATRNDVNPPHEGVYALSWQGGAGSSMSLDRLETGFLVLARFKILEPAGTLDTMWEAQVIEWDGSQEAVWSGFRLAPIRREVHADAPFFRRAAGTRGT